MSITSRQEHGSRGNGRGRRWLIATFFCGLVFAGGCGDTTTGSRVDSGKEVGRTDAVPRLVDIGADQCLPCKMMAPILEQLGKEYRGVLAVEFIDVWKPENREMAKTFSIETIPTQLFFDAHGKELFRHVGFMSKEDILAKWEVLGVALKPTAEATERASQAEPVKTQNWCGCSATDFL